MRRAPKANGGLTRFPSLAGLHSVAGATAIQTIRGGTESTIVWAVGITLIMWFFSNLRDFSSMSKVGLLASSTM